MHARSRRSVYVPTDEEKLIQAIENNNEESLKTLFSNKLTETKISYLAETSLLTAVRHNKPLMVDIILRYGFTNVNAKDNAGRTSLFLACKVQLPCIEIVTNLLAHKADVNLSDNEDITPLMRASHYGNVPIMNLLIQAGANIDAQDCLGRTAVVYNLQNADSNPGGLKVLLFYNAKLNIPQDRSYNPLLFAISQRPDLVDAMIPFCKYGEHFSEALESAISTNKIDIFKKLIKNCPKIYISNTNYLLNSVISKEDLADCFDSLWSNINHKLYLNSRTFAILLYKIFQQRNRISFFESSLKAIINTPDLNNNLTGELVISTIFVPNPDPYDWNLCKGILLEFCEYIYKQGIELKGYDLIIFVQYFKENCQFITELLAVFFKYDTELVTMYDVINLSCYNDLNLTSQLLQNCSDFHLTEFSRTRSIYELDSLNTFSKDMLRFYLQRFTPTKSDSENIRYFKKFDDINVEGLEVPTLIELARNALKRTMKNNKLKMFQNVCISSAIEDIIYFKTTVNNI